MNRFYQSLNLQNEYLTSYLRDQIDKLGKVLIHIHLHDEYDQNSVVDQLTSVEDCISNIRKFIQN